MVDDPSVRVVMGEIEAALPIGVRRRQLSLRTLLIGILLALADGRPAHLTRVHAALLSLPASDQRRLGVTVDWHHRPHGLSYRQVERTCSLLWRVLRRDEPDGTPSTLLQALCDALAEASVAEAHKASSSSLAVDWTDMESFSRPPLAKGGDCSDPQASWGHRRGEGPGRKNELFFGYYAQLATMVRDEGGTEVPELVRRMTLTSCHVDPPSAFAPVLLSMPKAGVTLGDVLCDSGYAHRVAEHWALPLRQAGAKLVMDLHPHDRGPQGTHEGAVISNGSLFCPATPSPLLVLGPPPRDASAECLAEHDAKAAEADHYRLRRLSADDADGYHRVICPAVSGQLRCPIREQSLCFPYERPTVLAPPEHPPACCTQKTITVPPSVAAKTAQKHPYPSEPWRRSYARRTAVERSNSRIKDPASIDVARGFCRVMGLAPLAVLLACGVVVRNLAVTDAFEERQAEQRRRQAAGLPPRTRRRRRRSIGELLTRLFHAFPHVGERKDAKVAFP